jgi:single-strand DNA-binding protein
VASRRDFQRGLCKIAEQYLKKGSKIYIEGQLQTRKYTDKDGIEKYSTEVVLQNFNSTLTMLDTRGGGGGGADASDNDFGSQGATAARKPAMAGAGAKRGDMDDEIPF